MFSRLVVPLDGSSFAESALGPARMLAKAFGSALLVVRAEPCTGLPFVAQTGELQGEWELLDEADAYLNRVVSQLRSEGFKADLTLFISEAGSSIARAAELSHADAIVMMSHLRWMLPEHARPSTTLSVLARSHVPVFVCRTVAAAPNGTATSATDEIAGSDMPIIVPLDGSRLAEAALPYATALARAFDSYLVLTQVVEPLTPDNAAEAREAADYLQAVQEEIAQAGGRAVAVVQHGTPITGIEAVWRESNGGLIVIATHGWSGPSRTSLGSVTAWMIEELEAPMLAIHPQGALVAGASVRRGEP